jgi:hypothetical protein
MSDKRKTWLERIEQLDPSYHDFLLREALHVFGFSGEFPQPLSLLQGHAADMGFEDIGSEELALRLRRAFSGTGVVVPNTHLKIRFVYPHAVIEPLDGSEMDTLPTNWKSYLTVFRLTGEGVVRTWVGKNVRIERTLDVDFTSAKDAGDGWELNDS